MKRKIDINYFWHCEQIVLEKVPEMQQMWITEELERHAEERIALMLSGGYLCGDLFHYVDVDIPGRKTPPEGWEFIGKFNIKKDGD